MVLAILPINELDPDFAPKTCMQTFFKVDQSVRKLSWSSTNKDHTVIKFLILLTVLKLTFTSQVVVDPLPQLSFVGFTFN